MKHDSWILTTIGKISELGSGTTPIPAETGQVL